MILNMDKAIDDLDRRIRDIEAKLNEKDKLNGETTQSTVSKDVPKHTVQSTTKTTKLHSGSKKVTK